MSIILKADNISKQYRLGTVGTGTLGDDLKRWWYNIRGKEDPFLKVGAVNDRSSLATEDYVWALRDINFEVKEGEVLGIIGKNGAGKSTLLKLLSRVTAPTTGSIKTRGRIASLLEVGTGFHGELTGRENIFMNGAVLGMSRREIKQKLEEIIYFSGCEKYIDTPVKRYSSGMTVRLGFAVAAHLEPEILVVDEVLAVGDAEFQKKAIGKMQDLSKGEGRTVLFVSHNMASIRSLCDRALVLNNGSIEYDLPSEKAIDAYLQLNNIENGEELAQRKDRSGSAELIIRDIKFFNEYGEAVDSIISGDFLRMRVYFQKNKEIPRDLVFGFSIRGSGSELKSMVVSDEMDIKIDDLILRGYLDIVYERILLRGGTYNFQFILAKRNTIKENHIDYIENATVLHILRGDFYNTGNLNREYSASIIPCEIK